MFKHVSPSRRVARSLMGLCLGVGFSMAGPGAWASNDNPFANMGQLLNRPAPTAASAVGANQLWGQLFQLLRDADGLPSKARFEGAFGPTMRESLIGGDAAYYGVNSGQGRYFDVGLSWYHGDRMHKRTRSATMVDEQQACVGAASASQDLMALGWVPGQYDRQNGHFYSFARLKSASRGQAQERIFLYVTQEGCVSRVSMSATA